MTKYFFNIRNSDGVIEDTYGAEFNSDAEAKSEAVRAAREMISDGLWQGRRLANETFEIVAEDGTVMEQVPFQSVVNFD